MPRPSMSCMMLFSMAFVLSTFKLPVLVDSADDRGVDKFIQKWMNNRRPTQNLPGVGGGSIRNSNPPASGSIRTPPAGSIRTPTAGSIRTGTGSIRTAPTGTGSIRTAKPVAPSSGSIRTAPTDGISGGSIRTTGGGSIRTTGGASSSSSAQSESVRRRIASNQCACSRREPLNQMVPVENLYDHDQNKYKYTKKIADDGSMAVVYHGFSYVAGHCIAIKVSNTTGEDHWRNESLQEVKLLEYMRSLNLKHVIRIETHAERNGKMSTLTEWAEINFREYWQNFLKANAGNGKMLTNEIKELIMELLEGLAEVHDIANVIHADLKPQNVMLMPRQDGQRRGTLIIIDFGGSQRHDQNLALHGEHGEISVPTATWDLPVASARYYAPEQRIHYYYRFANLQEKSVVSIKSDIWAIGNIIYEMVLSIHNNTYETNTPNEFIYKTFPPFFVEPNVENLNSLYEKMRDFYQVSEQLQNSSPHKKYIRPLIYMARACLHADPRRRPLATELLKFMRNQAKMTVSRQYQKNREISKGFKYDQLLN